MRVLPDRINDLVAIACAAVLHVACGASSTPPDDADADDAVASDAGNLDAWAPDSASASDAACGNGTTSTAPFAPAGANAVVLTTSGTTAVPPPPLPVTTTPPIIPWSPWLSPSSSVVVPNAQCRRATRMISLALGSAETSTVREVRVDFEGTPLMPLDPAGSGIVEPAHASGWPVSFYKPIFSLEHVTPRTGTLRVRAYGSGGALVHTVSVPDITVVPPPPDVAPCDFSAFPHPRVWLTPARLARARARGADDPSARRYWAVVDSFLNALSAVPDPTSPAFASLVPDAESHVPALALCYQLERASTGGRADACAGAAMRLTDQIAADYSSGRRGFESDGGSAIRSSLVALMLAFDWLHDELSPGQRATYATVATRWIRWYRESGPESSRPYSAPYAGYLHAIALTLAATASENPDAPALASLLNEKLNWELPVLNQRLCGGDWPEGWHRGALAVQELQLVNVILRDVGADHSVLFDWIEDVPLWLTYAIAPDFTGLTPFGTVTGPNPGEISPALLATLSSTTRSGALASRLYSAALTASGADLRDPSPGFVAWEMLFADTATVADVSTLPLSYAATGTGRWISRSSLSDPDAYQVVAEAMSYAGDGYGHANGDVRMYRGRECLLCPAAYRGSVPDGAATTREFSSFLVNQDPQGPLARNAQIVSMQSSPELSAVALRFASSYASGPYDEHVVDGANPLHYLVREVVHLQPGVVVVHDMHFRRHPTDTITALWHLASAGDRTSLNERSFTTPTAAGTLRVDAFADFFVTPVLTTFEVDADAAGRPIGVVMSESYLNDGSVREPLRGTPQETDAFHVFSNDADQGAVRVWSNLSPAGALHVLEISPNRCLTFEHGGAITLRTVADLAECTEP